MTITNAEEALLQNAISKALLLDIWRYTWTNPYIFTDRYLKMLKEIRFKEKFDTMSTWKSSKTEIDKIGSNTQPDVLSAFIREFGELLKKENDK